LLNPDFAEMLAALSAEGAEYLVVGAYALAAHGLPRATGDIDLWVRPTPENAGRVVKALRRFGAPLFDLTLDDLARPGTVFQLGVPPRRIDIMTSIDGVEFEDAWAGRVTCRLGAIDTTVLGREQLLQNKRAVARPKDRVDVHILEQRPGGGRRRGRAGSSKKPRRRR
jgi:hypothetical protein